MRPRCWCSGGLFPHRLLLSLRPVRPSSATRRARFHVGAAASLPCCLSLAFLQRAVVALPRLRGLRVRRCGPLLH
jgi:hypothetical protein